MRQETVGLFQSFSANGESNRLETLSPLRALALRSEAVTGQSISQIAQNRKTAALKTPRLEAPAATLLVVQGVHTKDIQAVIGWDQAPMIEWHAHVFDEMRKEAATRMAPIPWPLDVKPAKSRAS